MTEAFPLTAPDPDDIHSGTSALAPTLREPVAPVTPGDPTHPLGEVAPEPSTPVDSVDDPDPAPPTEEGLVALGKKKDAVKQVLRETIEDAGIEDVAIKELPLAFNGLRTWWHEHRLKSTQADLAKETKKTWQKKRWGQAAIRTKMYKDHVPSTWSEGQVARRAARTSAHRSVNIAARRQLEYASSTAQINPETGLSRLRDKNGQLNVRRSLRKEIERGEREWKKLGKDIDHEEHKLVPKVEHSKKKKSVEQIEKKLETLGLARDLKVVRSAARQAYQAEQAKIRVEKTDDALKHREQFYEDLGETIEDNAKGGKRRTATTRHPSLMRGGAIEEARRIFESRRNNVLSYERGQIFGRRRLGSAQSFIKRREKMLEKTAPRYKQHKAVTQHRSRVGARLTDKKSRLSRAGKSLERSRQAFVDTHKVDAD